jgi:peptide/nickel transport system permease protein
MPSLGALVARRVLQAVPLLLGAVVLNFLLIHLAPGDPARTLAGESGAATPEVVEQLRHDFGLDRPLVEQLLRYVGKVARGDLAYSFRLREPVSALIAARLPPTLLLMASAFVLAFVGGVALGVLAARRAGTWLGAAISVTALLAYATPSFWFALMLIVVFAVKLQWLPTYGMATVASGATGLAWAVDVAAHLVLPVVTLALFYLSLYARVTRASMLEVMRQDFVTVARAKGLGERRVVYRHVLRNALLGVTTLAGLQVSQMIGGSVLIETVFAWPGMGRLLFDSVVQRDYPVLLGVLVVSTLVVIVINLVTDLAYGFLDPRIRLG